MTARDQSCPCESGFGRARMSRLEAGVVRSLTVVMTVALLASCGGSSTRSAADAAVDPDGPNGPDGVAAPVTFVAFDHVGIGAAGSTGWPNIGSARAGVDWGAGPFSRVTLVLDLDTTCFPFEKWSADPPPTGQNWPADCDAFDRNLNVFIDDGGASSGAPPFEVVHAVTPFGGPEHLEVDLTDLANGLPGAHTLRVDLPSNSDSGGLVTGSNAGWTVSARVDVAPGPAPRSVLAVVPLYVGSIGAGAPFPVIPWEVPPGATGGRLEYRASGHGQGPVVPRCRGPAEEFCDRRHQLFIDGEQIDNIEPYREDCKALCTIAHAGPADGGLDYCLENPCGDVASVQAPRANWCPGTMTPPFLWEAVPALSVAGSHTFSFQILNIGEAGTWMVSATYIAYGP
jgi:hypothetical protein